MLVPLLLVGIIIVLIVGRDGIGAIFIVGLILYWCGVFDAPKTEAHAGPVCLVENQDGWCEHRVGDVYSKDDHQWHIPIDKN